MKIDTQKILEAISSNRAKLMGCVGPHNFQPFSGVNHYGSRNARLVRCTLCGGEVDDFYALWYERGLAHGKKFNE